MNVVFFPQVVCLFIVTIERFHCRLQFNRNTEWIESLCLISTLLGHPLANIFPEVSELGHIVAGDVIGHRHAWQLHDSTLDGVHEGKIAHRPGEQGALGVAGTTKEKRRRRQVNNARDPELAFDGFETRNP